MYRTIVRHRWRLGAGLLLGVLFALFIDLSSTGGGHAHFAGTCRAVSTSAGVGDIAIDDARGIAYVAYLDRVPNAEGKQPTGTVMLMDLNAAEPRVRGALVGEPPNFRPVALSLYVPAQGARRLFVVDSAASIHIFEQSQTGAFALVKTIRDASFEHPMAIAAVGPEQFYVTANSAGFGLDAGGRLARWWKLAMPASRSSAVYYDGQSARVVTAGLKIAAGLAASRDASLVYVSEMGAKRLQIFSRDAATGTLRSQQSVSLPALPDHLSADADGNVWIAAHPRVVAALKSLEGTPARVPTQVLRFSPVSGVSEVYLNEGAPLAGGTAAATHARQLVIGSLSDHQLLLCDMK